MGFISVVLKEIYKVSFKGSKRVPFKGSIRVYGLWDFVAFFDAPLRLLFGAPSRVLEWFPKVLWGCKGLSRVGAGAGVGVYINIYMYVCIYIYILN